MTETEATDPVFPQWVSADWTVIGTAAASVIAALFAISSAYGVGLALIAEGGTEAILPGLLVGAYLAFSAVGAESWATSAFSTAGDGVELSVGTRMIPFGLWAVFLWLAWRGFQKARAKGESAETHSLAFCAKYALAIAIPLGVIGSIVSFDDSTSTSELTSNVAGGAVFMYSLLAVAAISVWQITRDGALVLPDRIATVVRLSPTMRDAASSLVAGAKSFVLLISAGAVAAIVAAIIVADDPTERFLLVAGAPVYAVSLGVSAAVVMMGGAVSFAGIGVPDHVSLLHFGFPPGPSGSAAPLYLAPLLLAAPVLSYWGTKRRLKSTEPTDERSVVFVAFYSALGFGLTAWIASGVGQFSMGGGAHDLRRGFASIDVAPSVSGALGLGLLWGAVGAAGAALAWGRPRGMFNDEAVEEAGQGDA